MGDERREGGLLNWVTMFVLCPPPSSSLYPSSYLIPSLPSFLLSPFSFLARAPPPLHSCEKEARKEAVRETYEEEEGRGKGVTTTFLLPHRRLA